MYLPNARPVEAARVFSGGELAMFGVPTTIGAVLVLVPRGRAGRIFMEELECAADSPGRSVRRESPAQ